MMTGYWCEMRWLFGNCAVLRKSPGCSPSRFSLAFLCEHGSFPLQTRSLGGEETSWVVHKTEMMLGHRAFGFMLTSF